MTRPSVDAKTGFRFSYLVLGASLIAAVGSHFYALWTSSQQEKAMLPRPAVDHIIKALRAHHQRAGRFPESFAELDTRIWRQSPERTLGDDGHSFAMANYYYIYYLVDSGTCTLWAIPINKRRDEGSTLFLALTPETARRWKGAALALTEIKQLPGIPDPAQLALLGLTEQQPIQLKATGNVRKSGN